VYSERMIAPLLVRATRPEPKPFLRAGAAIDRELAHAKEVLFRKEFPTLAHLPKSVERARELVMNARAGKKVPVSLTRYCLNGTTRRDHEVHEGIVAADPRLFKLGHYVDLYLGEKKLGRFLIDDTGGNVKGATLDIWTPSCSEARRFGRQRGAAMLVAKPESAP
jgi:3D (Asp-Asp-Asp) domain-containing protein